MIRMTSAVAAIAAIAGAVLPSSAAEPIEFGATGQNLVGGAQILQIQNEAFVLLAPEEIKQGSLRLGVGGP